MSLLLRHLIYDDQLMMTVSQQQDNSNSTTASSLLCTQSFHTVSRLNFDIKKIDSVLTFGTGECMSLIGNYSKILLERLCIRALLSERHGGFGSRYVIIIDARNNSDIYSCINLARQYGFDQRHHCYRKLLC